MILNKILPKKIKFTIYIFLLCTGLESCAQGDIYFNFQRNVSDLIEVSIVKIDTIQNDELTMILPITNQDFVNQILRQDKYETLGNIEYTGGEIKYEIKQCSNSFVSIVKQVYIEDLSSPRGFFAWEETINKFQFKDSIYNIGYISSGELRQYFEESMKDGELDSDCLDIDFKTDVPFYFDDSQLYLHNPISSPFCNFDLKVPFTESNLEFSVALVREDSK